MINVPASTREVTAEWLTEVLRSTGRLKSSVTDVGIEPIGAGVGLMGELARLYLSYSNEESLPSTMVVKCAIQNENRQVAQTLDFYNREADFYNRVAEDCPLRLPTSYYADVNQDTYDFVLLMEDLGDVSPRDQLVGASKHEVFTAVAAIAGMHIKWWGVSEADHPWMYDFMGAGEAVRLRDMIYLPALEQALDEFSYIVSDDMKSLCRRVGEHFVPLWSEQMTPFDTFVHGDYRQDNMLYTDDQPDALVMDWQISGRGKGVFDIAYFMCQSVASELRAEIERDVLQHYVASLAEAAIDYSFENCWNDYRQVILGCLIYPITVCGSLDTANERGRALGECMLSRNLAAIEDHGSVELIPASA